jgi:hypothetical protein
MHFLAASPDIQPITDLINTWIHIGQALVGSVGALAFIFAFLWMKGAVGGGAAERNQPRASGSSLSRPKAFVSSAGGRGWQLERKPTPTPRS